MQRRVSASLDLRVQSTTRMAINLAVADPLSYDRVDEDIQVTINDAPVAYQTVEVGHGSRLWVLDAVPGEMAIRYRAEVTGRRPIEEVTTADEFAYRLPSRYCESDRMIGFASRQFQGITGATEILYAVSSWVGTKLSYVSGSSGPTDGAIDALLAGQGVCRDFAHLTVALLRAMEIPARVVAVYAPGLSPMDFHAVAEALIDGRWQAVDATLLAPRSSLVRIATGRDAADTSFLSNYGGIIELQYMEVGATVNGSLPLDDVGALAEIT